MREVEEKKDFFSATKNYQGAIVGGLAMVAAVGLYLAGYRFGEPITAAGIGEALAVHAVVLLGVYFLFLIGVTIYSTVLKDLAFAKYPLVKALLLVVLMVGVSFLLRIWFGA